MSYERIIEEIKMKNSHQDSNANLKMSSMLSIDKKRYGKLPIYKLTKEVLTELYIIEDIKIEDIAILFDVPQNVIENSIVLAGLPMKENVNYIDKHFVKAERMTMSSITNYYLRELDNLLSIKESKLRRFATEQLLKSYSEVFFKLGLIKNENQLVMIKKDENSTPYMYLYNLTVAEALYNFDILEIPWTIVPQREK
ncbi:MAG: hypothetical protein R3Y64_06450 [Peptostreptococcaceae bacterium]